MKPTTEQLLRQLRENTKYQSAMGVAVSLEQIRNYRLAYLYISAYGEPEEIEILRKVGHCKCGQLAVKWNSREPICGNCSLQEVIGRIDFG